MTIDIGSQRELFVDYHFVERLEGACLQLQQPRPAGIAVSYDQPWEDCLAFYTTVLKDGDTYRMYYRANYVESPPATHLTCYAESADGIHWLKPDLGLVEFNGSKHNNVILPTNRQFCVFVDERPGVPADESYKANSRSQHSPHGLVAYASGDGIHWKQMRQEEVVPMQLENNFDSQTPIFWSKAENCYVLYARYMVGTGPYPPESDDPEIWIRSTTRATSRDFLNWTEQIPMTYSDTDSTKPSQHLYTNQTHPYFRAPHIYISLPGRIHFKRRALTDAQAAEVDPIPRSGGAADISDGVLLTTRAGTMRYDFTFRESFVRPGIGYEHWTSRSNYPALGIVQTGPAEMSLYVQRGYGLPTAHLERLALRLDGFASIHAPYTGGEMLTRPFKFSGSELEINHSTSAAGGIRVEIQEADGRPLPGYSLDQCPEIIGDEIERIVAWQRGSDVGGLQGRPVRLRFALQDADLFALRFRS